MRSSCSKQPCQNCNSDERDHSGRVVGGAGLGSALDLSGLGPAAAHPILRDAAGVAVLDADVTVVKSVIILPLEEVRIAIFPLECAVEVAGDTSPGSRDFSWVTWINASEFGIVAPVLRALEEIRSTIAFPFQHCIHVLENSR